MKVKEFLYIFMSYVFYVGYVFYVFPVGLAKLHCGATPPSVMVLCILGGAGCRIDLMHAARFFPVSICFYPDTCFFFLSVLTNYN